MTSQGNNGIPLSHAPDGRGYKLLELPPELAALLEGDDAPILALESSDTAALLKAAGKSYSLRQKNTSNALVLLSPAPDGSGGGMVTVGTVHETIELVPEGAEPAPQLGAKGKWHEKFSRNK